MSIKAKRIIILGASGFIGKYLFDKFSNNKGTKIIGFSSKELDLLFAKEVDRKLSGVTPDDVLILTSAITRLKENTFDSMLKNARMAENIANLIIEHPVGQVIYLSTIDVYGVNVKKGVKITERTELSPNDHYSISKLAGEFLLRRACGLKNIPLVILRLNGVYGPGDHQKSTINAIVSFALREKKIFIYGRGEGLRDYIYVDDIYRLTKYAIDKKLDLIFNAATGKSYSIAAIARIVRSSMPVKIDVEFKPIPAGRTDKRAGDLLFDCSCLKKNFPGIKLLEPKDGIPVYLRSIIRGRQQKCRIS